MSYNPGFHIDRWKRRVKSLEIKIFWMSTSPKQGWRDNNFKSNLTLVVFNHPVKIQVDQTKRLQVRVQKSKYFIGAHNQNRQMEGLQFQKQQSPGGVLSPC